ncbi:hypothetical protein Hanom_Chr08g00703711 [Helianthus anomalus]
MFLLALLFQPLVEQFCYRYINVKVQTSDYLVFRYSIHGYPKNFR